MNYDYNITSKEYKLEQDLRIFAFAMFSRIQEAWEGNEFVSKGYVLLPTNNRFEIDNRIWFGDKFTKYIESHILPFTIDKEHKNKLLFVDTIMSTDLPSYIGCTIGKRIGINMNKEYAPTSDAIGRLFQYVISQTILDKLPNNNMKYQYATLIISNKTKKSSIASAFNIVDTYAKCIYDMYQERKQLIADGMDK